MLDTVSSIELRYLVEEMQVLISAKVDKIWQLAKKEVDIRFHIPKIGKTILRIVLPSLIYLSAQKQEYPKTPHGFTMFLRRRLAGARVREVSQYRSERIVVILFETKESTFTMVIELFGKGNVILCDENYQIISPLEHQRWADREVKAKVPYVFPDKGVNIFEMDKDILRKHIDLDKTLVKSLAIDFGIGGVFAEEIVSRAGMEKDATAISDYDALLTAFRSVVDSPLDPRVQRSGDAITDILPFPLVGKTGENAASFMEALDAYHSKERETAITKDERRSERAAVGKVEKILEMQQKQSENLKKKIEENTKKGELIYHHLQDIKKLYAIIETMKKDKKWSEIKEELETNSSIVEFDLKTKKVTLKLT